jgi:hypothetical protein
MKRFYCTVFLMFVAMFSNATDYYLSITGGATNNTGTSVSAPWPIEWAVTNQFITYTRGVDNIWILAGTYTGKPSVPANGGTNQMYWACGMAGTASPQAWVRIRPYNNGRVVIDAQNIRLQYSGYWFSDIEFTDSTKAASPSSRNNQPTLDCATSSYDLRVENCIATYTGHWPGSSAYCIGNDLMFVGAEFHEHGFYGQLLNVDYTNGSPYRPIIGWNMSHSIAGEAVKFIDGGYGALCVSNVFINGGITTPQNGGSVGFSSPVLTQHGTANTNAVQVEFRRNWFLANWNVTQQTASHSFVELYNGTAAGFGCQFIYNKLVGPDMAMLVFGNAPLQAKDLMWFNVKSNNISSPGFNGAFVLERSTPWPANAQMDYNNYYTSRAPGDGYWQWNNTGLYATLSAWTNATDIGGTTKADINATYTTSDSTLGGADWQVLADPITTGRGHILAINTTAQANHDFDLSPLGLSDGQRYTLMYAESLTLKSSWQTNTFSAASPNLNITLTTNAWPMQDPQQPTGLSQTVMATNSLPQIGAWLVYPAPQNPTLTATPNGGRTTFNLSWSGGSRWYGVRIYRSVNAAAYAELTTVDSPTATTYADVGTIPGNTYNYKVAAYNAYSEANQGTLAGDSTPVKKKSAFDRIYYYFFRMLMLPK